MSDIVTTSLGQSELVVCFTLLCGTCSVCTGLFVLPLGAFGRQCSVIVALPGHLLYYVSPCTNSVLVCCTYMKVFRR